MGRNEEKMSKGNRDKYSSNEFQKIDRVMEWILSFVLLIYSLRNVASGIDLYDSGYALGNYRFFDVMNENWKIATYLSNVIGVLFSKLPMGDTWIGMNLYTSMLIGLTAAGVYLFLVKKYNKRCKYLKYILFAAEFVALSLCWSPSVILYQNLGYILMTVAILCLYTAIYRDNVRYFMASGVILGVCVAVRMPNITYMAFIVPLWYWCFINRSENDKWFATLLNRTLVCIVGYLIGVLLPLGCISIKYGITAYPDMISWLFNMTETATDYKPTSMVMGMFEDYINYGSWLILFIVYLIAGVIATKALNYIVTRVANENNKDTKIQTIVFNIFRCMYIVGCAVLVRFCYGRGVFGVDYTSYFSVYKLLSMYLLLVIFMCIWVLLYNEKAINKYKSDAVQNNNINFKELKLWAVFLLVTIFVTPLGGNNGLYYIINNMFIVAPVSVYIFIESVKIFDINIESKSGKNKRKQISFVYKSVVATLVTCITFQCILFGMNFKLHDILPKGETRVAVDLKVTDVADGLKTTQSKKQELENLDLFLYESGLYRDSTTGEKKKLILFGDIPALAYVFDMEPAIYTTWIDLESHSAMQLKHDLEKITSDFPVIIFGKEAYDKINEKSSVGLIHKKELLLTFMKDNGYEEVYTSKQFVVYVAPERMD